MSPVAQCGGGTLSIHSPKNCFAGSLRFFIARLREWLAALLESTHDRLEERP